MTRALCMYAASDTNADMFHAVGMWFPDPMLWFRSGRRSYLVAGSTEFGRAKSDARVKYVLDRGKLSRRAARRVGRSPRAADVAVEALRDKNVDAVTVPDVFPVAFADALRAADITVDVRAAPFFPERVCKSEADVDAIRSAQAATERALDRAVEVLRSARAHRGLLRYEGERVTADSLRREIELSLASEGLVAKHTIVSVGDQCVDPHNIGSGPIPTNTPIVIDIFPRDSKTGFYADQTRTVLRGRPSREIREIYDVVKAGQEHAFARIRGGCDAQAIHRGIRKTFDAAGWKTGVVNGRNQGFFHGTGHGVGLDIHELPTFGEAPSTLPTGAVVTVEPGLYYERIGGVRLEDMVLVTEDGCENLTGYPKELVV